ncbi:autotransporter assembly complex protein TamB [Vibrio aphrogenes]|uniref:autotransporter assembly complex protein TamB n=1 Tax=Vibrio aphrogenes TaxID=1891186 RepID=UPI000B350EE0|nr:translocation/assembly module TamB domain-containing protein [Vibrio aphrogenes]
MKRLLKWLLGIILVIPTTVLVAILLLVVLLFTNVGLQSGLWVVQKLVPQLTIESTQGSVLPAFSLHNVSYQDPDLGVNAQLKHLDFSTSINCLFKQSICIDTVSVDGFKLDMPHLPESDAQAVAEDDESSMPAIFVPIPISLTHLKLNDIQVDALGYNIAWQHFSTGLYLQGRTLTLRPTQWQSIRLSLPEEDSSARQPEPHNNIPLAQQPDIQLPTISLPIGLRVEQFDVRDFVLQQASPLTVNHLGFQGRAVGSQIKLSNLQLDMPQVDLKLDSEVTLSGQYPLELNATAAVKMQDYSGQTIQLKASGSAADLQLNSQLNGGIEADINAHIQPLKATLPFNLSLRNAQAQWPFKGDSQYQIAIEYLEGKGSLEQYHFELESQLSGQDIPQTEVGLAAQGNLQQMDFEKLSIDTLGGNLSGQAMINWAEPLNWKATLGLTNIQPGLQWPEAEGVLNGSLINTGRLTSQGGWRVNFPSLAIEGQLRNYPLLLQGRLSASDLNGKGQYRVKTPGLKLSHANNALKIKGKLDQDWDMNIAVNLAKLSDTIPNLAGQISGDLQLTGQQNAPSIVADLTANAIDWQQGEARLRSLSLQGQVAPLPAPSGNIRLIAEDGFYQENQLKNLNVNFQGDQQSHTLTLDALTDLIATQWSIQGGVTSPDKKPEWQGQLQSARITILEPNTPAQNDPVWQINHPVQIHYGVASQQADIQAHCWQNLPAKICLDKDLSAGDSGEASVSIQQFPFMGLKAFLPPETRLEGQLNADAWFKWANNMPPQLTLNVDIPAGKVTQKLDTPLAIPWDKISLSAVLQHNKLDMNWLLALTANGQIEGQASIANVSAQTMSIDGSNSIKGIHLGFLRPILGQQNDLNAQINSQLSFKGPILHPQVQGNFDIDGIQAEGQMFPVDVHQGDVKTQFNGYSARLTSLLNTADGDLHLQGEANWAQISQWNANLRVFGDELKAEVPPMVMLKVKPDLTISLTPQVAKITGNIDIPWGRILVEDLPESAISVSKDEVLLDHDLEPVEQDTGLPMAIESDVMIHIGDDVSLSAFGLKGNLEGSLKVSQKDRGPFILGEIRIEKGYYQSFGQDLIIQEGKILMNGPADQPYLAIKAVRNPDNTEDDVIAGIQVTGPADAPEVTIFSEPAMSQTNALSYLLRGRGVEDGSTGSAMTTALIGLSLAKSGRLVGQLGEAFGVQDLQLGTSGSGDDSQVTVSGYIAPGLQVKYGVGIFNALGEFTVRYELLKDFYVEAVTGVDSAVDFLYQFSFH